jgi:hypothetical protein
VNLSRSDGRTDRDLARLGGLAGTIAANQNLAMADLPSTATVCVTFRYPDGSKEFVYMEQLPLGSESITRNGTTYVVSAIDTDGAGNTMVSLERAPLTEPGGELAQLAF